MTSERVIKAIWAMAELYGKEFSPEAAEMLSLDLAEYPEDATIHALNRCRKELRTFPTVSEIVQRINPEADPHSLAVLAAHKIIEAVRKDGNTNPSRARQRMGELAWKIVSLSGGWLAICENVTDRNTNQNLAQWRDLAKALQDSGHSSDPKPALTGQVNGQLTHQPGVAPVSVGNLLKQMPKDEDLK